jgi:hypothetical protein
MNDLPNYHETVKREILAIERSIEKIQQTREDLDKELKLLMLEVAKNRVEEDSK